MGSVQQANLSKAKKGFETTPFLRSSLYHLYGIPDGCAITILYDMRDHIHVCNRSALRYINIMSINVQYPASCICNIRTQPCS